MAASTELSRSSDASYVRWLLERKAACLVRVRLDGVLLACNHAALGLFAAGERGALLDSNLIDRLVAADRTQWDEFVARCSANGAASFECHLVIRDDNARPVLLQGVPLTDHPDGVESLLLHLRDQSQALDRSIESAAIDHFENEERQRAGDQIEAAIAERVKLAVLVDEDQAECRRLVEALDAQAADRRSREARVVELEKKLERSRVVLLQKEREYGRDVAMLKSALAAARTAKASAVSGDEKQEPESVTLRLQAATAEQERLQALVAEHEIDRERVAADHRAAVDTLQQSLAQAVAEQSRVAARVEEQTHEQELLRAEHQRTLFDLEVSKDAALAQLAQTSAEHGRLAARVEAAERELDVQCAEHARAHESLIAEHHRALVVLETGKRDELEALEQRLQAATAEHGRLQALVEEGAIDRQRIAADHRAALDTIQQALAESQSELANSLAEQSRVAARAEEQTREQELLRAEHARAHDHLIAEHHRALADLETARRDELGALEQRLLAATAEHARLHALVEQDAFDRERIAADHRAVVDTLQQSLIRAREDAALDIEQARQEWAASRLELVQALAEQGRIAARVEEQTREQESMRAEHERAHDHLVAEHQRAIAELQTGKRDELEALERRLQAAAAEHGRLQALVEQDAVDRERLVADHRTAVDTLQQSLVQAREDAAVQVEQSRQEWAASRLELVQALAEQSRIAARVEEQTREQELMRAEHQTALLDLEASKDAALANLETGKRDELAALDRRLQAATAEQGRLQALVEQDAVDRERIAADHRAAVDTLQQALARAREDAALDIEQSRQALTESRSALVQSLAEQELMRTAHRSALLDLEGSKHAALEELRAQFAQTSAEQSRLAAQELGLQRAEHERAHQNLIAEHHRVVADLETGKRDELDALDRRLQAATAEHARLQALVQEDAVNRERVAADHQAVIDTLRQSLDRTREDAALDIEQSRQALAESRSELAQAAAVQTRIAARVEEQTREQELMRAEHQRALADGETSKREALDELRSQLSQTLVEQRRLGGLLEEHERARDRLIAEHHRALAEMENGKREALGGLRSQLSQAFVDQRRLASHADEQELELNRVRAEHEAALAGAEARHRDALAELRRELIQTAERAQQHERDRLSAEQALAIADLQASTEAAAAELRSKLSDAVAEQHRLTALLAEHDRERERLTAEHRRTIADLQASKQEAVAECERVLTEVQQALLVRDTSRRLEIERRLIDGLDEGPQMKVDGQRLAALQSRMTLAFTQMQAVIKDGPAAKQPLEAKHEPAEDVDLLHEPFDDADDAFVHQLLEGIQANRVPETQTNSKTTAPAKAVSAKLAPETADEPADDIFDAKDATFARRLMDTLGPLPPSATEDS